MFWGFGVNGETYEGMWSEGRKHGKGKVTFKDGTVKQGKWKDNAYWYAALDETINYEEICQVVETEEYKI